MGIAEQFHLEYSTYAAFVGTEEEREETIDPRVPIDAIEGEETLLNQADDLDGADLEDEMLESIPLPGEPSSEAERRQLW